MNGPRVGSDQARQGPSLRRPWPSMAPWLAPAACLQSVAVLVAPSAGSDPSRHGRETRDSRFRSQPFHRGSTVPQSGGPNLFHLGRARCAAVQGGSQVGAVFVSDRLVTHTRTASAASASTAGKAGRPQAGGSSGSLARPPGLPQGGPWGNPRVSRQSQVDSSASRPPKSLRTSTERCRVNSSQSPLLIAGFCENFIVHLFAFLITCYHAIVYPYVII